MKNILALFVLLMLLFSSVVIAQDASIDDTTNDVTDEELPNPGILPDSPLYVLKTAAEAVGTFFTFGQEKKADRMLALAELRLAEADEMNEKGNKNEFEKALRKYAKTIANAERHAANAERKEQLLEKIAVKTAKHVIVLDRVDDEVPDDEKPEVEDAKNKAKDANAVALKALAKNNPKKAGEITKKLLEKKAKRIKEKAEEGEDVSDDLEDLEALDGLADEISDDAAEAGVDTSELDEEVHEARQKRQEVLEKVLEKVPESAKKGILNAISAPDKRGHDGTDIEELEDNDKEELEDDDDGAEGDEDDEEEVVDDDEEEVVDDDEEEVVDDDDGAEGDEDDEEEVEDDEAGSDDDEDDTDNTQVITSAAVHSKKWEEVGPYSDNEELTSVASLFKDRKKDKSK